MKLSPSSHKVLSCMTLLGMFSASIGSATPLPSRSFQLSGPAAQAVANDPLLKTTKIMRDHATNALYVSPASQKVQSGNFEVVAPVECPRYNSLYELTYKLPATNDQARNMAERLESTGPYFDMLYANYYFFNDLIKKAYAASLSIQAWQDAHRDEIAEIDILQARIDNVDARLKPLNDKLAALDEELGLAQLALLRDRPGSATYAQNLAKFEEVSDRAAAETVTINAEKDPLEQERLPLVLEKDILTARLNTTKPMDYEKAVELAGRARSVMTQLNTDASAAHKNLVDALNLVEAKTVGYANASHTVWDAEQSKLQAILSSTNSPYNAQRLPIFNVEFSKIQHGDKSSSTVVDAGNKTTIAGGHTLSNVSNFGLRPADISSTFPARAFATMKDKVTGVDVDVGVAEKQVSGTSFGFNTLVTQGVYCSGKNSRTSGSMSWALKDGYRANIIHTLLPTPRTTPVIAQDVKLKYQYHQKTDPIAVVCTLEISKFESFARNAGSSKFLFWGKKWDNAERERINNNGLTCQLDINAQAGTPQVDAARAQEIYQNLMQDLAAEYILNFASDYDVIATEAAGPILTENGQYTKTVGPAMTTLCGANAYCQIANVVFLGLEQLLDARSGKISRVDTQSGVMTRKYSERSYTTVKDESKITVEVRL